ncbi:(2Fe-2S) ferredoxin domain-containing protein [Pleurocapsa sp. FMAR1]|uniref:(2Fe-2S) ferredoxin domain-containing protein n=1 Tax=Pleurocapsa sp. FMAR1 TaxID=3040204 RepID=UPI0029C6AEC3|nr:(2Fe-2S) ferredoxin domain-containing protein [Pleurocapsa sp. FMAR1]
MMASVQPLVSEFTIVGRLEDFVVNSHGCVKHLYLSTPEEDYSMVVAKEQKNVLNKYLKPGCYLKVTGMRKNKLHQEKVEYKAYRIELLSKQAITNTISTITKPKVKVLICQSSTCWQKGGKAAYEMLQALQAKDMTKEVEIITTGCLKQCKQAPNLVIMPGRNRYSRVQPKQVSQLIAKHLL